MRHSLIAAAYVLLVNDKGQVLMGERQNTGFKDGQLMDYPAGHIEQGELATDACLREGLEEIGIVIEPSDLEFAGILQRVAKDDERAEFFFFCHNWTGEITNKELTKCKSLNWYDPQMLPDNTVDYLKVAIPAFFSGQKFIQLDTRDW
jgi:8-oxo-dGTP diphosphatase